MVILGNKTDKDSTSFTEQPEEERIRSCNYSRSKFLLAREIKNVEIII